jgi:hypothetical protein
MATICMHACLNSVLGTVRVKLGGGFCLNPHFKELDSTTALTQLATIIYQNFAAAPKG